MLFAALFSSKGRPRPALSGFLCGWGEQAPVCESTVLRMWDSSEKGRGPFRRAFDTLPPHIEEEAIKRHRRLESDPEALKLNLRNPFDSTRARRRACSPDPWPAAIKRRGDALRTARSPRLPSPCSLISGSSLHDWGVEGFLEMLVLFRCFLTYR